MNRDVLNEAERERVADVFQAHRGFVESVAAQHVAHPQDVPDVVQAVAVRVCQGLNGFRDEAKLTTWLYQVTVNTARTYYRRERRAGRVSDTLAAASITDQAAVLAPGSQVENPEEIVTRGERMQALKEALDRMRPAAAESIRNQLDTSGVLSGSKVARFRARQELRDQLAGDPRVTR